MLHDAALYVHFVLEGLFTKPGALLFVQRGANPVCIEQLTASRRRFRQINE